MSEKDTRAEVLKTFLNTPHQAIESLQPIHQELAEKDPLFYQHLAAWYFNSGVVRDHKLLLVINLCLSAFPTHRAVGLALLNQLAPYEIQRVIKFIKGDDIERAVKTGQRDAQNHQIMKKEKIHYGLFKNVPRSLRTEVARYLAEREADVNRFGQLVVNSRHSLLDLYAGLHIKPGVIAQQILFAENPPEGSLPYVVKQLAKIKDPVEQAKIIINNKIPFRIAVSVIQPSPATLVALIETMTPQELINNLASITNKGALEHPEIKKLVEEKLKAGKSDKRVQALKAQVAANKVTDAGIADLLDDVTDARLQANVKIARDTAILIDKSSSMDEAIEVGKTLLAMIGGICTGKLIVSAFDSVTYSITLPTKLTPTSLEQAMLGINPTGSTSCGVAIESLLKKDQRVEQIVMITDEQENETPTFRSAMEKYAQKMGFLPDITLIKVGNFSDTLEKVCFELGANCQILVPGKDYYALPNVLPMLARPTMADLVEEIMNYPLPERRGQNK